MKDFTFSAAKKAYIGAGLSAIAAGLATAYTALDDGVVSGQETVGIIAAVVGSLVVVFGGVWAAPNRPAGGVK